jgi:two-component system, NarL family, response regulator LiaR
MSDKIRVVLIDDHHVVRRGLRSYLESFVDITVVGEAASGEAALEQMERWLPDVAVLDLLMPGGIDGIETTRRIRAMTPHTQVVVLTAHTDEARVMAALRAGAIGYLRKDGQPEMLLAAVRAAAQGQSVLDPSVAGTVLHELTTGGKHDLTPREIEVLRLLASGRTNNEIAEVLVVSAETVKTHVGNILTKLHLAHRAQAVIYALKRGLISLDEIDP